jgi:hypothetical protein
MSDSIVYLLLAMGVGFFISKTLFRKNDTPSTPNKEAERSSLVTANELELKRIEKELKEKKEQQTKTSSKENEDFWKKN